MGADFLPDGLQDIFLHSGPTRKLPVGPIPGTNTELGPTSPTPYDQDQEAADTTLGTEKLSDSKKRLPKRGFLRSIVDFGKHRIDVLTGNTTEDGWTTYELNQPGEHQKQD